MVSEALVKLSSPVARSCLIALGIALLVSQNIMPRPQNWSQRVKSRNKFALTRPTHWTFQIDAVLTFFAASQYPYLIPYINELYLPNAHSITIVYSAIGAAAILLAISTALASYKSSTNFVLVVSIYFSTIECDLCDCSQIILLVTQLLTQYPSSPTIKCRPARLCDRSFSTCCPIGILLITYLALQSCRLHWWVQTNDHWLQDWRETGESRDETQLKWGYTSIGATKVATRFNSKSY